MQLTIVYDGACGFCRWCRDWLAGQDLLVPVTLRPSSDAEARRRWGSVPGFGEEMFVADDEGRVWTGPDAFVVALWATAAHRRHAAHLTGPLARRLVRTLSSQRGRLSGVFDAPCADGACGPDAAPTT